MCPQSSLSLCFVFIRFHLPCPYFNRRNKALQGSGSSSQRRLSECSDRFDIPEKSSVILHINLMLFFTEQAHDTGRKKGDRSDEDDSRHRYPGDDMDAEQPQEMGYGLHESSQRIERSRHFLDCPGTSPVPDSEVYLHR